MSLISYHNAKNQGEHLKAWAKRLKTLRL